MAENIFFGNDVFQNRTLDSFNILFFKIFKNFGLHFWFKTHLIFLLNFKYFYLKCWSNKSLKYFFYSNNKKVRMYIRADYIYRILFENLFNICYKIQIFMLKLLKLSEKIYIKWKFTILLRNMFKNMQFLSKNFQ